MAPIPPPTFPFGAPSSTASTIPATQAPTSVIDPNLYPAAPEVPPVSSQQQIAAIHSGTTSALDTLGRPAHLGDQEPDLLAEFTNGSRELPAGSWGSGSEPVIRHLNFPGGGDLPPQPTYGQVMTPMAVDVFLPIRKREQRDRVAIRDFARRVNRQVADFKTRGPVQTNELPSSFSGTNLPELFDMEIPNGPASTTDPVDEDFVAREIERRRQPSPELDLST